MLKTPLDPLTAWVPTIIVSIRAGCPYQGRCPGADQHSWGMMKTPSPCAAGPTTLILPSGSAPSASMQQPSLAPLTNIPSSSGGTAAAGCAPPVTHLLAFADTAFEELTAVCNCSHQGASHVKCLLAIPSALSKSALLKACHFSLLTVVWPGVQLDLCCLISGRLQVRNTRASLVPSCPAPPT